MVRILADERLCARDVPVAAIRCVLNESVNLHSHDFLEIVLITGGVGIHVVGEDAIGPGPARERLEPGDVLAIPCGVEHGFDGADDLGVINIIYRPEWLRQNMARLCRIPGFRNLLGRKWKLNTADMTAAMKLSLDIESEIMNAQSGYETAVEGILLQMLVLLSRACEVMSNTFVKGQYFDEGAMLAVAQVIDTLEDSHLLSSSRLRVSDMASSVYMSEDYFSRLFRRIVGIPPSAYMLRLRVQRAAELLCMRELTVAKAAEMAGFDDGCYFSRAFKGVMGVSPSAYRKAHAAVSFGSVNMPSRCAPKPTP